MALLNLTDLGVRRDGRWLLWDVNLEIDFGEIVGIFGRSDSGKTTLARAVAGLDDPTHGSIVFGEPGGRVSLATGSPAFAPELSVYENLMMFASLWGIPRRRRAKDVAFLLELVGLADRRTTRASRLSSGAAARLEIARALVADAPLTIFDSVLDTLDPSGREKLWNHLLESRRTQRKSFMVMTSVSRVAELCSRIAVIHRGSIGFTGRPDDFRRLAGEDVVVIGEIRDPMLRHRITERIAVVVQEQEGFLSFRVAEGERIVGDLLSEFGSDLSCVYLKRPTLDDALDVMSSGSPGVAARVGEA